MPLDPRRGRAGRKGGGNKTIDLEDVSSASKGSVIEVLCEHVHTYIPCWGIDPPFLPGDVVNSAGLYPVFLLTLTFYLPWSSEYSVLVRIWSAVPQGGETYRKYGNTLKCNLGNTQQHLSLSGSSVSEPRNVIENAAGVPCCTLPL